MENSEVNSNSVLDASYLTYPVSITAPQAAVISQNKAVLSSLAHLEAHLKCLEYQCQCACPSANKTVLVEECLSVLQQNQELDARLKLASTRCETLEQHLKHAQVVVESAYTSQHEDSAPKHELRFPAPKLRSRALSLAFNRVTEAVSKPPSVGVFPASAKAEDKSVNSPKSSFEISSLSANIPIVNPVTAGGMGMSPYVGAGDNKPKTSIMEMTVANPVAQQISSKICNVVSTALPLKPPQQLDEYPVRLVDTYAEFLPHKIQRKGKKKPKVTSKAKLLSPEQKVFNSASTQDRQIINETKFLIDQQPNSEKTKRSENDKHQKPVTLNLNHMSSSIGKGRDLDVVTRVIAGSLPIEITVSTVKSKVFDNSSCNPTSARCWIQSTDSDIEATKIRTPWATTNSSKN